MGPQMGGIELRPPYNEAVKACVFTEYGTESAKHNGRTSPRHSRPRLNAPGTQTGVCRHNWVEKHKTVSKNPRDPAPAGDPSVAGLPRDAQPSVPGEGHTQGSPALEKIKILNLKQFPLHTEPSTHHCPGEEPPVAAP